MPNAVDNSGTLVASGQIVSIDVMGFSGLGIQVTGTWSGTISFEASLDGVTFVSLSAAPPVANASVVTSTTSNGVWQASCHGLKRVRARMSSFTSGTATVTLLTDPSAGGAGVGGGASDFSLLSRWTTGHAPAANTKATASQASAGAGLSNVLTGFTVTFVAGASAPTALQLSVAVIDGASGGTTYLWGPIPLAIPAVAGATNGIVFPGPPIKGSAATAMTLEFSVAGGANTVEGVTMQGGVVST